jgi:hypothetical protein
MAPELAPKWLTSLMLRADNAGHILLHPDEIEFARGRDGHLWFEPIDPAIGLYKLTARTQQRLGTLAQPDLPREAPTRPVECWYWLYRDSATGQVCVSEKTLTEEEASNLPEAERIEGSKTLRGTEDEDTTPDVFRTGQAPLT